MKRLRSKGKSCVQTEIVETKNCMVVDNHHHELKSKDEIRSLRKNLIDWYDSNKRNLQWRDLAKHRDPNIRGYSGIHFYVAIFYNILKLFFLLRCTADLLFYLNLENYIA